MLYMYLLTAAACRARGLAAARSISRRSLRLRAGATNTLDALREELDKNNVDAFVIPSDDPHLSEYVAPCFERRAFASGFTGSAGTAVVLKDRALCWTDGRYWLQASQQLGEGWELVKAGAPGVDGIAAWFGTDEASEVETVGIDARVTASSFASSLEEHVAVRHLDENPVDKVWVDRPAMPSSMLRLHPLEFAGESVESKLGRVRTATTELGASGLIISALDEVCWLFNVRGGDVSCNPVCLAYAYVDHDTATLFVDDGKVPKDVRDALHEANVDIRDYDRALPFLRAAASEARVCVDPSRCSAAVVDAIPEHHRINEQCPVADFKAVKNEGELRGMRAAHVRDGAAVARAFSRLEKRVVSGEATSELDVDALLLEERSRDTTFIEPSFPTIAGAGGNGALIHGSPSDSPVTTSTLLLVDSGGQYADGTTDATRTMHFGEPTAEEKRAFTAVLKGHIGLDVAVFPENTIGFVLDAFARKALWACGLDYGHGTGHGVGAALNVHEGPISVSPRFGNTNVLREGMVLSNEPGYYQADCFGVRIENLLAVEKAEVAKVPDGKAFLKFSYLTLIPIDATCIDVTMLDAAEVEWVNAYHADVRAQLAPLLEGEALDWLVRKTEPLAAD